MSPKTKVQRVPLLSFRRVEKMKRFRVLGFDLDRRALSLVEEEEHWDDAVKQMHRKKPGRDC